jgi:ribosome-associated protein
MDDTELLAGIPAEAITLQFVRASGPGGQNVNKVSTAVQLRVDLDRTGLPASVRARLERLAPGQITQHGELIIAAQRFRSQHRNRQDAFERLAGLLDAARTVPKKRVKTRPSLAQKRRREAAKKQRGEIKKLRGKPTPD